LKGKLQPSFSAVAEQPLSIACATHLRNRAIAGVYRKLHGRHADMYAEYFGGAIDALKSGYRHS
jgi:hypothetical protein